MAFLVYKKTQIGDEWEYHDRNSVVLAGGGLIQSACRRHLKGEDSGWTVSASDMLAEGGYAADNHALVVDTSPKRSTVNLYEITSVSGYSYEVWTPIMLTFEQLFGDAALELILDDGAATTVDGFKASFKDGRCERRIIRSFLYLMGGHSSGNWNWGGNNRTTAGLLPEDAWDFFTGATTP